MVDSPSPPSSLSPLLSLPSLSPLPCFPLLPPPSLPSFVSLSPPSSLFPLPRLSLPFLVSLFPPSSLSPLPCLSLSPPYSSFPTLLSLLYRFLEDLQKRQRESAVVKNISDIILQYVSQFPDDTDNIGDRSHQLAVGIKTRLGIPCQVYHIRNVPVSQPF